MEGGREGGREAMRRWEGEGGREGGCEAVSRCIQCRYFAVDLISLFSRVVHTPTVKLKTTRISSSNPHTSTSPQCT